MIHAGVRSGQGRISGGAVDVAQRHRNNGLM